MKNTGPPVILARFIHRQRSALLSPAPQMPYLNYVPSTFVGNLWVGAMILGGYSWGRSFPNIVERIVTHAVVIVVSVFPQSPVSIAPGIRSVPPVTGLQRHSPS